MTRPPAKGPGTALLYGVMLVAAVVGFFVIDACGRTLPAPEPAIPSMKDADAAGKPDALVHVLVALAAVLVVGRLLGLLFRCVGQPPVIGEVVGGIVLGPSVLGWLWPEAAAFVLP